MTLKERLEKEKIVKIEKKLRRLAKDSNVRKRILTREKTDVSQFPVGSASWFLEDIRRLFHPELKSIVDAEATTKATGQKVFGVYLREEPPTGCKKIGKATVVDGQITRETSGTNQSYHLRDIRFIPCANELAAYMLEYILQIIFGRHKRTQSLKEYPHIKDAIDKKFSKRFEFWIRQQKSRSNKSNTGSEWFKPDLTVELFESVVQSLAKDYKDAGSNKRFFPNLARDYQLDAVNAFVDCVVQVGSWEQVLLDSIDFYLLMKPRSGKNLTMLLALAKLHKRYQTMGCFDKSTVMNVLFISLVPAAFDGTMEDIEKHWFDQDVKIDYVDTSNADWKEQRSKKIKQGANIIILFSSMQSIHKDINKEIAKEWRKAETLGIQSEEFDPHKKHDLLNLDIEFMVLDESDFGLRTLLAESVIKEFKPKIKLHLSGSDLYAIRKLTSESPVPNYYLRDVIAEDKDIEAGKVKLPKLRYWFMEVGLLPFDDMTADEMDEKAVSRCLKNLYLTNIDRLLEKATDPAQIHKIRKYSRDPHTGFWVDGMGNEIKLENEQEMRKFKRLIGNLANSGFELLEHKHIFNTVPTQVGQLAFENFCKKHSWFDYEVKTGYEFGNAGKRQRQVRDWMGISEYNPTGLKKTWFVTVAKMLRGATVPWSSVVRCDEFVDFKIGHQIDLRAQNEYGPDGVHCDIFDMNPWRRKRSHVELMKMSSNKGDKFKLLESTANRLMPWCVGATGIRQSTLEETEDAYNNFRSLTDGFEQANLYNIDSVIADMELLKNVGTASRDDKQIDERAGKKKKKKIKGKNGNKNSKLAPDEITKALKLIKNFAKYLPQLQVITRRNNKNNEAYHTINDLLEFSSRDILKLWFEYVGLPKDITKKDILCWFNQDKLNEKLRITANKINRGLDLEELGQVSKPKAGDVPVPYVLAKLIVEEIPEEFWKRPNLKIFDPSCGKGDFLKVIKEKLENLNFTKKQISQTLFYADPEEFNILFTNETLDLDNGFVYNILKKPKFLENTTTEEKNKINKVWKVKNLTELTELKRKIEKMQFDLIITNPPYQSTDENGDRNDQAKNLWSKFTKIAHDNVKPGGIFTLVTPNTWMSTSADIGKGKSGIHFYRDYFQKYKVLALNINDCKKYFKEGTSFSYFIVEKTIADKQVTDIKTESDEFKIDLRNVPILPKQVTYDNIDILNKFFFSEHPKIEWKGNNLPESSLKDIDYSDKKSAEYKYPVYSTPAKGGKYFYRKDKMQNFERQKILLSESGNYKPVYDDGKMGYDSFCHVYFLKSNETLDYVKNVIEHPLYKFAMDQTQLVGWLSSMVHSLPALDFTKKLKSQDIYDSFGITLDQQDKIDEWFRSQKN
jgi:hypothetical protein